MPSLAAASTCGSSAIAAASDGKSRLARRASEPAVATSLGDLLFAGPPPILPDAARPGRVIHLGPIRIRM